MLLLSDKRIFIVEDNAQNRVIYQIILTRHGAKVDFDRWGRNTVAKMLGLPPFDLIIMDLMLPNGNTGYDIFLSIRNSEKFKDIPIVAVSAADASQSIIKAKSLGFNGFIAKPINDDLFPQQLKQIMSGQELWDSGQNYMEG